MSVLMLIEMWSIEVDRIFSATLMSLAPFLPVSRHLFLHDVFICFLSFSRLLFSRLLRGGYCRSPNLFYKVQPQPVCVTL